MLANFRAPSPEPHFPGIFSVASEPKGAVAKYSCCKRKNSLKPRPMYQTNRQTSRRMCSIRDIGGDDGCRLA